MNDDFEYALMCMSGGLVISLLAAMWLMLVVMLWSIVSPLAAMLLFSGPVIGYLYSKPKWISKFWKQKEYRE